MPAFTCNVCGAFNQAGDFATEPASCACGSNVRTRALIHLLSMELFGRCLALPEFPVLKALRGIGISDKDSYARPLAERFDYTNTHYDRDPRLDITEQHPQLAGTLDFVTCSDVLEHVPPPVGRALEEIAGVLAPDGFLVGTVFCNSENRLREHFPELHQFRVINLGATRVLVNRRVDGSLEITGDLIVHGGDGLTLEMREFGVSELEKHLLAAGFREIHFLADDVPERGIQFDNDVSQPFVARKCPFTMNRAATGQIIDGLRAARLEAEQGALLQEKVRMASQSRWLKLGRVLGLGPDFQ